MRLWYLISVWTHLLAAAVWIGSMVYLGLVLVPVLRERDFEHVRTRLLYRTGLRFRWAGWGAISVLVGTGIANVGFRGFDWPAFWSGALWHGAWGHVLGIKLLLVTLVLVLSAVHDFYLGPRATRLLEADPESPEARSIRTLASWIGRIMLLLSLLILWLAILLVRGVR